MLRRTYLCVFAKENKKINYAAYVQLCLKACLGCASAQSTGSRVYIYCSTQYAVRARCPRGGDTRKCGPGTDSMPCVTEAWSGTGLGPCLDHLKIPSFFTFSPSHQFLAACMEY
jgi:hypothetical protein